MNKILSSLITLFAFTGLQAQSVAVPHLVVGLTIDQLRTDYLEAFSSLYGEKGFKRLWKEAMIYKNIQYDYISPDRSSAIASIYTGTTPSIHGIIANSWLDSKSVTSVDCVDDASYMGNYTTESSSPLKMLASTICDELEIFTRHQSLVYSIAPFRDAAILSAGHSANGAFWINENSGKWCGSTYYGDFPYWASSYNNDKAIDSRISSITWVPCCDYRRYNYLPSWNKFGFKHHFADDRDNKYRRIIASPYANDEVNMFAEQIVNNTLIGRDSVPDMLNLTYYAGYYNHKTSNTLELQDSYVRMDHSIASLLDMLERKIGLQNIFFYITSTGYSDSEEQDPSSYHIPSGEFDMRHCAALLNMYLMAIYGNGQYVEGYYDNQIYLNHSYIEKRKIDLTSLLDKCTTFLVQFSGVNQAYSSRQLLMGAWNPSIEKMRNAYCRLRSGDLCISVLPGWTIIDEQHNIEKVVRNAYIPTPLIFLGNGIKSSIINTLTDASCIAPTITSCLHIRAPNASLSYPLSIRNGYLKKEK